jgi:hypothetical protein
LKAHPTPQGVGLDSKKKGKSSRWEKSKWEIVIDEGGKILIRKIFTSTQFTVYLSGKLHVLKTFRVSKNLMGFS